MTKILMLAAATLTLASCQTIAGQGPSSSTESVYRALGTEPFWSLEIEGDRMLFSRAGENAISSSSTSSRPSFNGWRYISKAITADVTFTPCSDGMSDLTYKDTVTVMVDKERYSGCGGGVAVPTSLEKTRWRITSINGANITPEREAMLFFDGGRMSGTVGCNRLNATYGYKAKSISFGPVMSTRMGCPDPIAAQETALVKLLGSIKTTAFLDNGSMILAGQGGATAILEPSI